jgi:hypothetical protein
MLIRFHKGRDVDVLTCIRPDGSTTWNRLGPHSLPIAHDLIHYAVETTLGVRNAFFGLVASGWDITTFTERGAARRLPPEAVQVEFLVGQLQMELLGPQSDEAGFLATLAQSCANAGTTSIAIDPAQLRQIRARVRELLDRWRTLAVGQSLEFEFAGNSPG